MDLSKNNFFIEKLTTTKSQQDIFEVCSSIAEDLNTSYFSYGIMWSDNFHHIKYIFMSNYESDWVEKYKRHSYHLIDPRIRECLVTMTPLIWNTKGTYLQKLSPKAKKMMQIAHQYNIRSGVTVPLHSHLNIKGVFGVGLNSTSYSGNESMKHLKHVTPYLSHLGSYIHQAMIQNLDIENKHQYTLTLREKSCLCWAADGKTASQIASILYISESTVKFHFKNIMNKLGARNTSQALSIAILKGIINPVVEE